MKLNISGTVQRYSGQGRQLGYPTANIELKDNKLSEGVYFGLANLAEYKEQPSLIFVGVPYSSDDPRRRLEAHLLDAADQDYYGQILKVTLMHFQRPNEHFKSLAELIKAL